MVPGGWLWAGEVLGSCGQVSSSISISFSVGLEPPKCPCWFPAHLTMAAPSICSPHLLLRIMRHFLGLSLPPPPETQAQACLNLRNAFKSCSEKCWQEPDLWVLSSLQSSMHFLSNFPFAPHLCPSTHLSQVISLLFRPQQNKMKKLMTSSSSYHT